MDDDRTPGWLLARLLLAVAVLAVIAIPLLAPDPMIELTQWQRIAYTFGPILAEALAIAGLVWMLWIWRAGARDGSSAWRYRDRVEQAPEDEPRDEPPPEDRRIADTRATGWMLARIELAVAATVVLLIPILFVGTPAFMGGSRAVSGTPELLGGLIPNAVLANGLVQAIAAEALAIAGLVWMVRIWRGPLRDQVPAWRYRR